MKPLNFHIHVIKMVNVKYYITSTIRTVKFNNGIYVYV